MKKKTVLILTVIFCVTIIGASILYHQLKDDVEREPLVTPEDQPGTEDSASSERPE